MFIRNLLILNHSDDILVKSLLGFTDLILFNMIIFLTSTFLEHLNIW